MIFTGINWMKLHWTKLEDDQDKSIRQFRDQGIQKTDDM